MYTYIYHYKLTINLLQYLSVKPAEVGAAVVVGATVVVISIHEGQASIWPQVPPYIIFVILIFSVSNRPKKIIESTWYIVKLLKNYEMKFIGFRVFNSSLK